MNKKERDTEVAYRLHGKSLKESKQIAAMFHIRTILIKLR